MIIPLDKPPFIFLIGQFNLRRHWYTERSAFWPIDDTNGETVVRLQMEYIIRYYIFWKIVESRFKNRFKVLIYYLFH